MSEDITRVVANMTIEQLLIAAQMEGIATVIWFNKLQLQGYVSISSTRLDIKGFPFMMDEARQIVEFPGEARSMLIMRLTKELTENRGA